MKSPFKGGFEITQVFGANPQIYKEYGFKGHEGIDLVPKDNDWDVMCVEGGEIIRDIDTPRDNYGNYVLVWNTTNKRGWWYCHLAQNFVSVGDKIKKGTRVGVMGNSGYSTGPHLHLGVRYGDEDKVPINTDNEYKGFVDPLPILETFSGDVKCVWTDKEGKEREMKWLGREWGVEKDRADNYMLTIRDLDKKTDELKEEIERNGEEVAKWRKMYETLEKQHSSLTLDNSEKSKMIVDISSRLKTTDEALTALRDTLKEKELEIEDLEGKIINLKKKNDLEQYSTGQLQYAVFIRNINSLKKLFGRIKRGDKK